MADEQKRYTITLDLYVYENTDEDAKQEASKLVEMLNSRDDCKANVLSIYETPFGTIGNAREVKK